MNGFHFGRVAGEFNLLKTFLNFFLEVCSGATGTALVSEQLIVNRRLVQCARGSVAIPPWPPPPPLPGQALMTGETGGARRGLAGNSSLPWSCFAGLRV